MAGQYEHRQFFRRMPDNQLDDYFKANKTPIEIDWKALDKKNRADIIFEAFAALPEDIQATIEVDFQNIEAMACEGGISALLDEAVFHEDDAFPIELSNVVGFHAKVMWVFLNKQGYWRGGSAFLHADTVSRRSWKKLSGLPHTAPHVDDDDIKLFAKSISNYFFKKEARGKNCEVNAFRRIDKEYFFAYPEDYSQYNQEWKGNTLAPRPSHPAFELIFVYCQNKGSLDIYAPKLSKEVSVKLQQIFAKTILKLNTLPDGSIDKSEYDLAPLASPDFDFKQLDQFNIEDVITTKLRLTLKSGSKRRILLEADTSRNSEAVYDLLTDLKPAPYYITLVGLKVIFKTEPGKKRVSTKSFTITYPNSCNLNHDGKDSIIREMLAASGIEPQTPVEDLTKAEPQAANDNSNDELDDILIEILEALAASGRPHVIDWETTQLWPKGTLETLVNNKLLSQTELAKSIDCRACGDKHCFRDVDIVTSSENKPDRAFILCEDSEMQQYMGRVEVPLEKLQQWRITALQLAKVIASLMGFDNNITSAPGQTNIRIGSITTPHGRRILSLTTTPLALEINGHSVPLDHALFFEEGVLCLDQDTIQYYADSALTHKEKPYSPSQTKREAQKLKTKARDEDIQLAYIKLRKQHPPSPLHTDSWIASEIKKLDFAKNCSHGRIKRVMKG